MVAAISSSSPAIVKRNAKRMKDKSLPTELWESAMREELRREQQRQRMVKWRQRKKEKISVMLHERRRLEKKLQLGVNNARVASDTFKPQSIGDAFIQTTVQLAALKRQNLALREAIEQQTTFQTLLQRDTQEFLNENYPDNSQTSVKAQDGGWRVHFPNGTPSFHFNPFTKEEFDNTISRREVAFAEHHPCTVTVGKILGWTVDYAPLARSADRRSFMAHARFTRRLRCTLDNAATILPHLDKKLWPVQVTPRSWGRNQTGDMWCQALQSFGEIAHVMACNIPSDVNLRYIALARHSRERNAEGKRVDKYTITIADSEANIRNREAEGPQDNVQWVLEGGTYMTITEVDEGAIDVVFNQWAGCRSEVHGRELYIDWIRFPVRLEQLVSPARLLCS